jgi:hypothetical protein
MSVSNIDFLINLKNNTYKNHKKLDTHDFVKYIYNTPHNNLIDMIKKKEYIKKYIHLHLIILYHIKDIIKYKKFNVPECFDYFNKEYNKYIEDSDLYKIDSLGEYLKTMDNDSNEYELFLSHCYCWYLALLYGGQIIKRKISIEEFEEEVEILTNYNCNHNVLIGEIKEYLTNNIEDKDRFIHKVNNNYELIYTIFNDFV